MLFVTIPYIVSANAGYTYRVQGTSISGVNVANEQTCSPLYVVNVSSSAQTLVQDFLQGSVRTFLYHYTTKRAEYYLQ